MTLTIEAAGHVTVALASLTRDPELHCRAAGVSQETAGEYAEALQTGAELPPVVVFRDGAGVYWLADGFHRCAAAELTGLTELPADVREGSRKDAMLYAASANGTHGLRRSNADKRCAVLLVLGAWPKWSDRRVAEAVGVSHPFVAAVRREGVVTVTTGGETDPPDLDRVVARLTRALTRVFEQWPAERRAELRRLLDAADGAAREGAA